jgi:hypothetical protein
MEVIFLQERKYRTSIHLLLPVAKRGDIHNIKNAHKHTHTHTHKMGKIHTNWDGDITSDTNT